MALSDYIRPQEIAVLFTFLCAVGITASLEMRWLLYAWRWRDSSSPPAFWPAGGIRAQRALTVLLNVAALGGLLCILYGRFIEPTWLKVEGVSLESPKIRVQSGTVRIVHLSDLHSDGIVRNERRAVEMIRGLAPDLIVLTGDYLNEESGLPLMRETLGALAAAAPVFLVNGNYDIGLLRPDAFKGVPVVVLKKEWREVSVRGTRFRIGGMEVGDEPFFERFARERSGPPAFDIFLHHYTDSAPEAASAGIDLYLAGHTHGGQVRLPFYGALITLAKFGKRFESGLYEVGKMRLYVNRGLGMEGGSGPHVRFLCRPEITFIELRAAGGNPDGVVAGFKAAAQAQAAASARARLVAEQIVAPADLVADNLELSRLYQEDQDDRKADPSKIDWATAGLRDEQRRGRVRKILADGGARTSADFFHAAMVFQHGSAVEDFRTANRLALQAVELDPKNKLARWLAAASKDRELMNLGKPQLYGTQFHKPDGGVWKLYEVDPSVPDEERAKWGVPPLANARKRAAEMNAAK